MPGYERRGTAVASLAATYKTVVLPEAFGAAGNGVADDTAALQAWLASGNAKLACTPGKTYTTTASLTLPATASIDGRGATIKATAAIVAPLLDTPVGSLHTRTRVDGLTLDCNNNADNGFFLRYAAHFTLNEVTVLSPNSHAVIIGDPGSAGASYEVEIAELNVFRAAGAAVPAGSYGLWMRFVQDSRVHRRSIIVGAETGVRVDRGSNQFHDVHVWGQPGHLPVTCFDDNSDDNTYVGCHGDTPTTYCFRLRTFRSALIGCHAYVGTNGTDNAVTGVYFDLAAPQATVIGCYYEGADVTHRLAKDADGAFATYSANVDFIGNRWNQVVLQNIKAASQLTTARYTGAVAILTDNADALGVRASDGTYVVNVNTNSGSRRLEVWNGNNFRTTSDAGTTMTMQINGTTGAVRPGRTTTATRPSGGALTVGDIVYDTTIASYIYWDGTNWRNFANTIV